MLSEFLSAFSRTAGIVDLKADFGGEKQGDQRLFFKDIQEKTFGLHREFRLRPRYQAS